MKPTIPFPPTLLASAILLTIGLPAVSHSEEIIVGPSQEVVILNDFHLPNMPASTDPTDEPVCIDINGRLVANCVGAVGPSGTAGTGSPVYTMQQYYPPSVLLSLQA